MGGTLFPHFMFLQGDCQVKSGRGSCQVWVLGKVVLADEGDRGLVLGMWGDR